MVQLDASSSQNSIYPSSRYRESTVSVSDDLFTHEAVSGLDLVWILLSTFIFSIRITQQFYFYFQVSWTMVTTRIFPYIGKAMFIWSILMTMTTGILAANRVTKRLGHLPCQKCAITDMHPYVIEILTPVCAACGELFGIAYEYCCLCHEYFYDKCYNAIRK